MTKFHMDLTPESAGKLLRDMAERTAAVSRNWDNFEGIAAQLVGDAYNAGKANELPVECDHEWVDVRNKVVQDGEICLKCGTVRPGNQ